MSNLIKIGRNNELKRATLELPKYGELTDERVVQEMRGVFDGFEYDPDTGRDCVQDSRTDRDLCRRSQ